MTEMFNIKWDGFLPVFTREALILALLRCLFWELINRSSPLLREVTRIIVAAHEQQPACLRRGALPQALAGMSAQRCIPSCIDSTVSAQSSVRRCTTVSGHAQRCPPLYSPGCTAHYPIILRFFPLREGHLCAESRAFLTGRRDTSAQSLSRPPTEGELEPYALPPYTQRCTPGV